VTSLMIKIITFIVVFSIVLPSFIVDVPVQGSYDSIDDDSGSKYAVIVVGRYAGLFKDFFPKNFQKYYTWYLNSAGTMYSLLKDTYGFTDENIFLLVTLRERYDIPDSFNPDWIDYDSNKDTLQEVLSRFKPGGDIWLQSDDALVFTYINHGGDDNKKVSGKYAHTTYFGFPYEFKSVKELISYFFLKKNQAAHKLYDWELGEFLENIYAGRVIFFLQPCFSGGFINDLSCINRIILSASRETELARASWIEPLIFGLQGTADANSDGKVSILEAYEYAARYVQERTSDEHPLLDDNADGIGHHFTEVGYNPAHPNCDGYLAARTYL
jgi:hypothetical protein